MSRFHGPCGKGAMAALRAQKRTEARDRASQTPPEWTRWYRQVAAMSDEVRQAILATRKGPVKVAREFGISPDAVRTIWQEAEDQNR